MVNTGLRAARAGILGEPALTGAALRSRLSAVTDQHLSDLFRDATRATAGPGSEAVAEQAGLALVAVGSYGRRDPAPGSDLDLLLLHDGTGAAAGRVADVAERLWYPLWDTGIGLDHAVRTVTEARSIARAELKVVLGLLDARHVAGSPALTAAVVSGVRQDWRALAARRLPELRAAGLDRAQQYGQLPFLLEPDIKESAGGIRDVHAMNALAAAWLTDAPAAPVREALGLLLDVRGELHRLTARDSNRLVMQEQPAVAAALGVPDADALLTAVSSAGRTIAHAAEHTWRRVEVTTLAPSRSRWRGQPAVRRSLAPGVVEQGGEVVLARDTDPAADPALVLRAAAAAAGTGLRLSEHTVARLAAETGALPEPWPPDARTALVTMLGAGPAAVPVLESLDQVGLLTRLLPEWAAVRCRPQRNPVHRFTVDRHLVETAVQAAALTRRVARPDLLLLGALLHDIGKGYPGDHSVAGAEVVARIGPRLGLPPADTQALVRLTRHHLLLVDSATRRDLDDPATVCRVAEAIGDIETLEVLHALTEADARATGEGLWTAWKAGLVAELTRRSSQQLAGKLPDVGGGPSLAARVLAQRGQLAVALAPGALVAVTVAAPNRPGVLSAAAGVLALNRLSVRAASAHILGSMSVITFSVEPGFGGVPAVERLTEDLRRALAGTLDVSRRLREREAAYPPGRVPVARPDVRLVDAATGATVVDVRAHDSAGLLYRVSAALSDCGLDIRTALVSTFGAEAVDAFYVTRDGAPLRDPGQRSAVRDAVLVAAGGAAPTAPGAGRAESD